LVPRFDETDVRALDNQRYIRRTITLTAIAATTAVLLASAQLIFKLLDLAAAASVAYALQLAVILASAALVWIGTRASRQEAWLLERFKAEQLRLVKYTFLTDPEWWCGTSADAGDWRRRLDAEIVRVSTFTKEDLPQLAVEEPLLEAPSRDACLRVSPAELRALIAYYESKRLQTQRRYFTRRAVKGPPSWIDSPRLLPVTFFGSLALVVLNFVFEMAYQASEVPGYQVASTIFGGLASALPALWAGLRFYRSAGELPRNVARSRARRNALDALSSRLSQQRDDPEVVFWLMRQSEHTLARDQREWLRLMREAKWHK
ncbi:MAG: hypothetical protein ACREON_06820, partial [Gemmatimonadaceae bacterium]